MQISYYYTINQLLLLNHHIFINTAIIKSFNNTNHSKSFFKINYKNLIKEGGYGGNWFPPH